TYDIWGALTNGLSTHIIDNEIFLNAKILKSFISDNRITIAFITTAAFVALLEQDIAVFEDLRYVLVGGETMSTHHMNRFVEHNSHVQVMHMYGPTENTVFSTFHKVNKQHRGAIPIGRAVNNSTCYVLDKNLKPVMQGAEGILYVGGDGVSKGYLNNPEMTAQKFLANPYDSNDVLYDTGDLVRWNEDFDLEYVGRIDTQVKIRGFRIELGEIEHELTSISGIKAARVIVKQFAPTDKRLVGYFTAADTLNEEEVIEVLASRLPEYMVPTSLIQMDELPLNSNGKLDVSKLPDIAIKSKNTFEAPRNEIEEQLVQIWKDVLGIPIISINDNFFDLGGHSLKAMKVLHSLSKNFELKLTHLFKYPTIKELSVNLVYKKNNLLENFKRLKSTPIDEETKLKAQEKLTAYRQRYMLENMEVPGAPYLMKEVLLTGVTGFLGVHILSELLEHTQANVHILIRAENLNSAEQRVVQKLNYYFGTAYFNTYKNRINILAGDMSHPMLGQKAEVYTSLADKVDTIFNPAANVKHY
ncbi:MAG TPA: AMP-binding protein, partial [Cytophagales bacterium]|nr:AMP-binding protein [Cytophagales bacterium]